MAKTRSPEDGAGVDWENGLPCSIGVTLPDVEAVDSLEDNCRQALADGEFSQFLERLKHEHFRHDVGAYVTWLHAHLESEPVRLWRRRLVELGFACGMTHVQGRNGAQWARYFKVRKQTFHQYVKAAARSLRLRMARGMRSAVCAENMRRSYARRTSGRASE